VGQLVAEALKLYGARFWPSLALGIGPAIFGVADRELEGAVRAIFDIVVGPLVFAASYGGAIALVRPIGHGRYVLVALATGFVAVSPAEISNTYAIDRNYRTPYAQTWNISIQHELPRGFFVELGYLGTKGTRLDVQTLPNEGPGGLQQRNQLGNALGFTYDSSVGNSIYHALQVRATQRFRRGISMSAFYTFSKSIDDSSSFGGAATRWRRTGWISRPSAGSRVSIAVIRLT